MHATRFPFVMAAFVAACSSSSQEQQVAASSGRPDLVVSASCHRVEDMPFLDVAVTNVGSAFAGGSTTRIEFSLDPGASVARATRSIAAHSVASFELEMPAACSRADCGWKVTADSANQVLESDEMNNTLAGHCRS